MLVIEGKCSKMHKSLQDHIKWIFAAQKIIRAILLFLSFLAYAGISQSTFCSLGFILTRAMGCQLLKIRLTLIPMALGVSKFSARSLCLTGRKLCYNKTCYAP